MQVDGRIVASYDPTSDTVVEELQILADIFDADGGSEVASISVQHAESGLVWHIAIDPEVRIIRPGREWFSVGAAPPALSDSLPRGEYVILVEDLSQATDQVSTTVPLNTPLSEPNDFPALAEGDLRIPGGLEELFFIVDYERERGVYSLSNPQGKETIPLDRVPDPIGLILAAPEGSDEHTEAVWIVGEVGNHLVRRSGPW